MEDEFWTYLFWFLSGALLHNFLSKAIGIAHSLILLRTSMSWSLRALQYSHDNCTLIQEAKYENMVNSGVSEQEAMASRKLDTIVLETWKETSVKGLINSCPAKYQPSLGFYDWNTAMDFINK